MHSLKTNILWLGLVRYRFEKHTVSCAPVLCTHMIRMRGLHGLSGKVVNVVVRCSQLHNLKIFEELPPQLRRKLVAQRYQSTLSKVCHRPRSPNTTIPTSAPAPHTQGTTGLALQRSYNIEHSHRFIYMLFLGIPSQVPFFRSCNDDTLCQMCIKLQPFSVYKGIDIIRKEDTSRHVRTALQGIMLLKLCGCCCVCCNVAVI